MGRATVVGLLGGVASGKSTVARLFEALGAVVLDADRIAREVLEEPPVREALVAAYGDGILDGEGAVDRARLADAAFGPPARTEALNRAVHPAVRRRLLAAAEAAEGVAVLDAALLLEAGLGEACDVLVFVQTSEANRAARASARGWAVGERARREGCQAALEGKREASGEVIDNDGPLSETRAQVERLFGRLTGRGPGGASPPGA